MSNTVHRLGAIMVADIASYSALMERDELHTFARLQVLRADIFVPVVAQFDGRIVKTTGDGFLAEFSSAIAALKCGIAIQRQNCATQEAVSEAQRFHLRIGINLGDIIIDGDDVSGDGVNVAARLEPLSPPDGLCFSAAVREQVREDLGVAIEDLGARTVKNLQRPVHAYRIDLAGKSPKPPMPAAKHPRWKVPALLACVLAIVAGLYLVVAGKQFGVADRPTGDGPISIAVLPFANLTGDPQQAYLADGLTASITADLTRIQDAFVVSAATAFAYKDVHLTAKQIGDKLGARFVLQGDVQRNGTTLRINAQLADASSSVQIWSETFEGSSTDLFALQDKVTTRIGNSMGRALLIRAANDSEKRRSPPTATELLLRARALVLKPLSEANWNQIERYYREALVLQPDLEAAIAGLALSLEIQASVFGKADTAAAKQKEAVGLAKAALLRNAPSGQVYFVLMADAMRNGDWDGALSAAKEQITLEPKTVYGYNNLAWVYFLRGEPAAALQMLNKVVELDPKNIPDYTLDLLTNVNLMAGNHDQAIEWGQQFQHANPALSSGWPILAMAYAMKGDQVKAQATRDVVLAARPTLTIRDITGAMAARRPPAFDVYVNKKVVPALRLAGFPE